MRAAPTTASTSIKVEHKASPADATMHAALRKMIPAVVDVSCSSAASD
jgi:hypothetical protein